MGVQVCFLQGGQDLIQHREQEIAHDLPLIFQRLAQVQDGWTAVQLFLQRKEFRSVHHLLKHDRRIIAGELDFGVFLLRRPLGERKGPTTILLPYQRVKWQACEGEIMKDSSRCWKNQGGSTRPLCRVSKPSLDMIALR